MPVYTIYTHPGVVFGDMQQRIAGDDIPSGTLLFLEHVICCNMTDMIKIVQSDDFLYSILYPHVPDRTHEGAVRKVGTSSLRDPTIKQKREEQQVYVGFTPVGLFHSCTPNTAIAIVQEEIGTPISFMASYAIRDIKKDEVITIRTPINCVRTRDDNTCTCGVSKKLRKKRYKAEYEIASGFYVRDRFSKLYPMLAEYFQTGFGIDVARQQAAAIAGALETPIAFDMAVMQTGVQNLVGTTDAFKYFKEDLASPVMYEWGDDLLEALMD